MSNFHMPVASQSAISLGGEWRSRDQAEANKYSALVNRKRDKNLAKAKTRERPRTSPGVKSSASSERPAPPRSAPPKPRCERVQEMEGEPSARKNLEAHLPLKKSRSPVNSPDLEWKQQINLGSGMTMTRSKSRVAVTINTGLPDLPEALPRRVFLKDPEPYSSSPQGDPERDALIVQLQQQVADLTCFLDEERLNHKATREKAAAAMNEKLNELERRHMEELKEITQEQEEQVEIIKALHGKEMAHLRTSSNAALARMKGELEFLQGAFEAYKGTLVQDMEEKWNQKEADMKLKFQEDMENALQEQRQDMLEERQREKKQLGREFQKQMQIMQKEHKKEIDNMLIKFSSASSDLENLTKALDQLKRLQDQLEVTTDKLAMREDDLRQTRIELAETRIRVTQFDESFQSRVDEVDEKYKERIHHLMSENTELRKRYMQKCDELFTEKSHTEKRRVEKLMNTKEVMQMLVHVKSRNNINLACSDPATDHQSKIPMTRPVSAPVTRHDKQVAFRSAGEAKHLHMSQEKELLDAMMPPPPPRPRTVAAHRVQSDVMREFSLRSPFRTESAESL